jgi:hypothetical protein
MVGAAGGGFRTVDRAPTTNNCASIESLHREDPMTDSSLAPAASEAVPEVAPEAAPEAVSEQMPVPLKPHRYPLWLVGVAAIVVGAVIYSATLAPPYIHAQLTMWRADAALAKGDRPTAEADYRDVLRIFPTSRSVRLEMAILLLADRDVERQNEGLTYLEDMKLGKSEWARVSAVLPERFRGLFHTVKK